MALVLAVAVAAVTLLVVRPWQDDGYTGRRPIPDRAGTPGRAGGKDCGVYVRGVSSGGISAAGWRCFTRAMSAGARARLRLTAFTTEGDPIFTTYTTGGNGAATVVSDARLDRFGGTANSIRTAVCRHAETRPVARGMFRDCAAPMPLTSGTRVAPIAEVFCEFASRRHVIGARLTTLARARAYSPGGPAPGVWPARNLGHGQPGNVAAAWCWTDSAGASGSPGPMWTLYAVLATGESVPVVSTDAGLTPPTAFPVIR